MGGDAARQVEAVHAQEQLVHVQRVERLHREPAVEGHVLAPQLAAEHDDADVVLGRERGQHAEVVGDHGDVDVRQRLGQLDAGGARIDGDGVARPHQRSRAAADAPLLFQMHRALGLVGRLRRRLAHGAAVDRTAVGARHHAALGQEAQVLAHGLQAHAEAARERGDLHAALLAHEFADLQAPLAGVAGNGHGASNGAGEYAIFR